MYSCSNRNRNREISDKTYRVSLHDLSYTIILLYDIVIKLKQNNILRFSSIYSGSQIQ